MTVHLTPEEIIRKPLPEPDGDTRLFWEGLKQGQLLLQHCQDCGHVQYYQQGICRNCLSEKLEHKPASGRGKVYSYSIVYRAPGPAFANDTPYAILLVELEEGPRMISMLVDGDVNSVTFDMPVQLVCKSVTSEVYLPCFRSA